MDTIKFLEELKEKGVYIECVDERLKISAERGELNTELVAMIKAEKENLLSYLKNRGRVKTPSDFTLPGLKLDEYRELLERNGLKDYEVEDLYNLNPLQEGFLYHSMMDERSTVYFEQISIDMKGAINLKHFEESWNSVAGKHAALRTMIVADFRVPIQLVLKNRKVGFTRADIREEDDKESWLTEAKRADRDKTFDLKRDPLFRVKVVQLEEERFTVIISFHHIILDGWCLSILFRDFLEYYNSLNSGREPVVTPSPAYANYISWYNRQRKESSLDFWKGYLSGYEEQSTIVRDAPTGYEGSEEQLEYQFSIDKGRTGGLQQRANEAGVTLNSLIQTAWAVVLARYNRRDDLLFGATVSGRPQTLPQVEEMVGLFINTIPVRIKLDEESFFSELLQKVQQEAMDCMEHHYCSLTDIQAHSELKGGLFDHIMVFENYPLDESLTGEGNSSPVIENVEVFEQINYDFGIVVMPSEELSFIMKYNPHKYSEGAIKRVASHLERVFEELISSRELRIKDIEIVPEDEFRLLTKAFNDSEADYPRDKTIIELFEEQVERTPDNVALLFGEKELTYGELNERANRIGNYLRREYEIKGDDLIAVQLKRSEKMIIALLGVLKSGAAYVPLDPDYPPARITHMLSDSNPVLVLGDSSIDKESGYSYEDIDQLLEKGGVIDNPLPIATPDNLAYVIYTSGSTGRSKGTLIENRNVTRLFCNSRFQFDFGESDVWPLLHSFCFDFSVWEIYGALLFGGKLVVVPREVVRSGEQLYTLLVDKGITILNQTPSAFYLLSELASTSELSNSIRYVIFGGEALHPERLANWYRDNPACKLINMYGITETTVHVTYKEIGRAEIESGASNIGKAIPTLSTYILDEQQRLLPIGVPGELCVSGAGVCRGYLNNESLTAEKIVADPFKGGERLYRSGDLAYVDGSGDLVYLGRIDSQVKVRGFRVELGEIESVLNRCGGIESAVVIAKDNEENTSELAAYLVASEELTANEVRAYLAQSLPEYMIPAAFVNVDSIPLTANGKVDKKRLLSLEVEGMASGVEYCPPRNRIEKELAAIWTEVLEIERLGIDESFFTSGGDSIKAIRLISRINLHFKSELKIYQLYDHSEIRSLAALLEQEAESELSSQLEEFKGEFQKECDELLQRLDDPEVEEVYPLSDIEKGMVFSGLMDSENGTYHDQFIYQLNEPDFELERFEKALRLMVEKHSILRTAFNLELDSHIVYKNPPFKLLFEEISDKTDLEVEEYLKDYMQRERLQPFELSTPQLWRMSIFKSSPETHLFIWQFHHAILDGWSNASFINELFEIYNSLKSDAYYSPQKLKATYKDHILSHLFARKESDALAFWQQELSGYERVDIFENERELGHEADSFELEQEFYSRLKRRAQKLAVPEKIIFLGAYLYTLKLFNYEEDLTIGYVTNNRPNCYDGERIVGCFLNTIPLRVKVDTSLSWRDFLKSIELKLITLKRYETLSLAEIAKIIDEKPAEKNPIFDILFNFVDFHVYDNLRELGVGLSETEFNIESYEQTNTYFDMTASVTGGRARFEFVQKVSLKGKNSLARFFTFYKKVLEEILAAPDSRMGTLSLLAEQERSLLLELFNDGETGYPVDETIVSLFEEQVKRSPERIAVVSGDLELSYSELNEEANKVAHYLRSNYAIEPDDLVAVFLDRSERMIIALLGILKAGAAYLPIDPDYPAERIDYMLKDSNPRVILSDRDEGLFIDINAILTSSESVENPTPINKPHHLAYVIYTSGSTGRPKGALIEHKNVVRLLFNDKSQFDFSESDVWTIFHSFCFDFSVWEMYGALLFGGKAVVVSREESRDVEAFLEIIRRERVTILNQTPTAFYNLAEPAIRQSSHIYLRYLIFGGEALNPAGLAEWHKSFPACKLINMFGITETTVHVTYKEIGANEIANNISNIGKPLPTLSTYILDKDKNLMPIGVIGELSVAGEGVCRGYLNRPELTAARFLENPFKEGERLYLSGDSAYINEAGELIYCGRIDNQVKIRGFRIELGEIENGLSCYEAIDSAVVVVKEGHSGERYLVAYYAAGRELDYRELRRFLAGTLPDYMIPSHFVYLDKLPLTANGKVDKRALPEPHRDLSRRESYVAPANELEERVAAIWEEVLEVEQIGVNDDFFDLGGHSLNALKLVSSLNSALKANIRLSDIFSNSTIKELSAILELGLESDVVKDLNRGLEIIKEEQELILEKYEFQLPADYEDFYPLSKIQQGMVFFSLLKSDEPIYHDQFVHIEKIANFDRDKLREAFTILSARHAILRSSFDLTSFERPYQIVHKEGRAELLEFIDLSSSQRAEQEREIRTYLEADLADKFMRKEELLWRMRLFNLGDDEYCLVFSCHHAILDGWSVFSFFGELIRLYNQLQAGEWPEYGEVKADYKSYVAINMVRDESEQKRAFWQEYLHGYSRNRLPFNYSNNKINDLPGSISFKKMLGPEILEGLKRAAHNFNCTLKELLLGAHLYLLSILCGERDIITGVVSHDRPAIEDSDKVLGCFLNTVPVRFELESGLDKREFLSRVKDNLRGLKEHELFIGEIAEIIGETNEEGNPLFDTIFNYTDFREVYNESSPESGSDSALNRSPLGAVAGNEMTNTLFDLELSITNSGINMQIKYAPSYFYPENIETAYKLFLEILNNLIDESRNEMTLAEIVKKTNRSYLDFNSSAEDYPYDKTISDLFEEQVNKAPDNVALIQGDEEITYRELNEKSNQLAALLREKGVRPGQLVGIMASRSFEMIIGMLAILKAGGAYVPIDPLYPEERKEYVIDNSRIELIVQDREYNLKSGRTILINEAFKDSYSKADFPIAKRADEPAYVIYTSGSTGRPKGVMIENHSIVNLINWVNTTFSINERDRLLFITSMCFDLSVYDIFGILSSGGALVIATEEQLKEPGEIFRILKEKRITFWDSVPSTFNYMIDAMQAQSSGYIQNDLRLVFMSGDWIPVNLPGKIRSCFPNARQISLGGATEGTVWSIYYPIDPEREYRNSIPYGKPLANNRFYILDEEGNLVPDGVAGELYIGGVGVARGYINDQEKTGYSFVRDTISGNGSDMMYRTGDYGRMLPGGNIEFLGRKDEQVKIRGYRVELGEIENVLLQNEHINSALVIAHEGASGDKEIAAYYVADYKMEIGELKTFLKRTLPGYMIPAFFIALEAFPLTSNGKIDRRALPKPEGALKAGKKYVAARNEVEKRLVTIWHDILGVEKIGIYDNFFNIGGHSLNATAVITRISKEFSVLIPLADFFEEATISFVGELITAYSWSSDNDDNGEDIGLKGEESEKGVI